MHEFVQNSVISLRSARTFIFALGAPLFDSFQQSARVCPKQRFQPEISTFCHFRTGCNTFHLFFSKEHEFVQNSVFSPRSACFVIFTLGTPLLSVFSKGHEFVQNSVFSRRSARFNIFALGGPLLSDFQQRASVCPREGFPPEISTFPHFRTGCTSFKRFLVSAPVCTKQRLQP